VSQPGPAPALPLLSPRAGRQRTVDPEGNTTTCAYESGRLGSITDPAGRSLSYTYDPGTGLLQTISDPAGNIWTLAHDGDGYLRQVTDPEQNVTGLDYDPSGRRGRRVMVGCAYPDRPSQVVGTGAPPQG